MNIERTKKVLSDIIKPLANNPSAVLYKQCEAENITVSEYLERLDPSEPGDKLDAFQRQFLAAGIEVSNPMKAPTVEQLMSSDVGHLTPEFVRRQILKGMSMLRTQTKGLIAFETRVTGNTIQPMYLANKTTKGGSTRIHTPGAELATADILYREKTISVKTYGKALNIDYRVVKNKTTIEFASILWIIGKNLALDQITDIELIVRLGDGTVGAATATTSGTSGVSNMDYSDFINVLIDFDTIFEPNVAFMTDLQCKYFLNLAEIKDPDAFKIFTLKGLLPTAFGFNIVRNPNGSARYISVIDSEFAIACGVETPLMIEADKIITRRMDSVAISEALAYWVFAEGARRVLDLQATT
jgi:hypothetical protein